MNYYNIKDSAYYNNLRTDILPYIPVLQDAKMLDVGCSAGNTLCFLKEKKAISEAVGVDFVDMPESNQRNPLLDRFMVADLNEEKLDLPTEHFDILLCADVLEHLIDPWSVLNFLKGYMKPSGLVIISLPNIREFSAMRKIFFKGDFQYAPSGILDKTHMRFFCKKNQVGLVESANFRIESVQPSFKTCPLQKRRKLFSTLTFGIFDQFLAQQYIITARKV